MNAIVSLSHESGVGGPRETIDVPEDHAGQIAAARAWAYGQIGWPWDLLRIEPEDGEPFEAILYAEKA